MKVSKERKKREGGKRKEEPPRLGVRMTRSAAWDMSS